MVWWSKFWPRKPLESGWFALFLTVTGILLLMQPGIRWSRWCSCITFQGLAGMPKVLSSTGKRWDIWGDGVPGTWGGLRWSINMAIWPSIYNSPDHISFGKPNERWCLLDHRPPNHQEQWVQDWGHIPQIRILPQPKYLQILISVEVYGS